MSDALNRRLRRIDGLRRGLLDEVEAVPPRAREARPTPGTWSILEVVEHLVLAEETFVPDLRNRVHLPAPSLKHRLLYPLVMAVLRLDVPVRVPVRSMMPTGEAALPELRARWDASQAAWREAIAALDDEALGRPLIRHPVAGPITPRQAVAVLEAHLRRHIRQVRSRTATRTASTPA